MWCGVMKHGEMGLEGIKGVGIRRGMTENDQMKWKMLLVHFFITPFFILQSCFFPSTTLPSTPFIVSINPLLSPIAMLLQPFHYTPSIILHSSSSSHLSIILHSSSSSHLSIILLPFHHSSSLHHPPSSHHPFNLHHV